MVCYGAVLRTAGRVTAYLASAHSIAAAPSPGPNNQNVPNVPWDRDDMPPGTGLPDRIFTRFLGNTVQELGGSCRCRHVAKT